MADHVSLDMARQSGAATDEMMVPARKGGDLDAVDELGGRSLDLDMHRIARQCCERPAQFLKRAARLDMALSGERLRRIFRVVTRFRVASISHSIVGGSGCCGDEALELDGVLVIHVVLHSSWLLLSVSCVWRSQPSRPGEPWVNLWVAFVLKDELCKLTDAEWEQYVLPDPATVATRGALERDQLKLQAL
jgi:hypothetical protein